MISRTTGSSSGGPLEATFGGMRVVTCPPPSRGGAIVAAGLAEIDLDRLARGRAAARHARARPRRRLRRRRASRPLTGTTHVSVLDGDGNAAALSSTLGSGSGVFSQGFQLNNMLGELDVIGTEARPPGDRLPSMMAPTLVLDGGEPRLVVGSAGSVRLAGAILQTIYHVVADGLPVGEAIDHPRLHVEDGVVQIEGGWPQETAQQLQPGRARGESVGGHEPLLRRCLRRRAPAGRIAGGSRRSTARRSRGRRPVIVIRRAEPGDAQALLELASEVGGEDGAWLLTTTDLAQRRRGAALSAGGASPSAMLPSSSRRTVGESSPGCPSPATSIPPAAMSPTSA